MLAVFGDSHVNALKLNSELFNGVENPRLTATWVEHRLDYDFCETKLSVNAFGSASASGLNNPNATVFAGKAMHDFSISNPHSTIALGFGRVDLDFVWPYKATIQKSPLTHEQYVELLVHEYMRFAIRLIDNPRTNHRILMLGLPLPTLEAPDMLSFVRNEAIYKDVSSKSGAIPSQIEMPDDADILKAIGPLRHRTDMTLLFNRRLSHTAKACGFGFLDIGARMLGLDGLVRPDLTLGVNHHANARALAEPWLRAIIQAAHATAAPAEPLARRAAI